MTEEYPRPAARSDVTDLLIAWREGDPRALDDLVPKIYGELKLLASRYRRRERLGHTLETTALAHEAYLRLIELERVSWQDRTHFFAVSARILRRILVDHARRSLRLKRGSRPSRMSFDEMLDLPARKPREILELDAALKDLSGRRPALAEIVELRYFGGLNRDEIAEFLGVGSATVTRRWRMARAWLLRALEPEEARGAALSN